MIPKVPLSQDMGWSNTQSKRINMDKLYTEVREVISVMSRDEQYEREMVKRELELGVLKAGEGSRYHSNRR